MKKGLVLEGGGSRGVFSSGVLDYLQEQGVTFDYCVGVSAGAGNAMNFKSGQTGRAHRIVGKTDAHLYYGVSQARHSGKLLDLDYLYRTMTYEGDAPFDFAAYYRNPMECEYTVTCCETGQAEYLSESVYQNRLLDIVKASCSLPGICAPVALDGKHYLDGGIGDSLPVFRAMSKGCEKVILVTTKVVSDVHPTDYSRVRPLMSRLYKRRYPAFFAALMTRCKRYFAELDEILELEKEGQILVIRPEVCNVKTLEKDAEAMQAFYEHGRAIGEAWLPKIRAYLSEE